MAEQLFQLAQELAERTPGFFETKGPGRGNDATNAFVSQLQASARNAFGVDYSEQALCGANRLCVDYYFPRDSTIVEVAFGLRNPNTEFEKDILKAVMAKEQGAAVNRLFFIAKPGGKRKCQQPGRSEFVEWLRQRHGIAVEVHDLMERRA